MNREEIERMRDALEACNEAMSLIPIDELALGHDWHPSETALFLLEKAINRLEEWVKYDSSENRNF